MELKFDLLRLLVDDQAFKIRSDILGFFEFGIMSVSTTSCSSLILFTASFRFILPREPLMRSNIPLISGLGHEVFVSLGLLGM